ncbi:MAG: CHAT domain-containing tetratricopeptide repeat protein [Planctomycetota bacterium]
MTYLSAPAADGFIGRMSPDSLLKAGIATYDQGRVDSARTLLSAALEGAVRTADTLTQARALTWLGIAAWKQGAFAAAREQGEQALELKLAAGLRGELWRSYSALGLVAFYESRLADAAALFDQAIEEARAAGDEQGIATPALNRGLIHFEFGDFAAARQSFETATEAGRALGDAKIEGNALTNLAMLEIQLGDPSSAISRLEDARRLYGKIDYLHGEENALGQLGTAHLALGDLGNAHAKFDSALALTRRENLLPEESMNLELLADLYRSAGDNQRALQFYAQARAINEELGDETYAAADLRSEAVILASMGDLASAFERAAAALEMHRSAGARFQELQDLAVLAEISQLRGRPRDVERYLSQAEEQAGLLDSRPARVEIALTRARIADANGDSKSVLATLELAAADLAASDYPTEWEAEWLASRAYFQRDELEAAVRAGRRAVQASERIRRNLVSGVLRTSLASARAETYSDLVAILLRRGSVEEAFQIADAVRGHSLREYLAAARDAPLDATVREIAEGEELLRRIDQLNAALESIETAPPQERDVETARELARLLGDARDEYEILLIRTSTRDDRTAAALGGTKVDLQLVREALEPGEVLLEYLITPDRLLIFVVSAEGVRIAESTISAKNLASRVRIARELIGRPDSDPKALRNVLVELFDILIQPAARAGAIYQASTLAIVPQGVLTYAPFAALLDQVTDRYLAESFAVLSLPSAAALPLLRGPERRRAAASARSLEGNAHAFAPFPASLPATAAEVEAVAAAIPKTSVALGPEATEADLRRALGSGGLVHVATHGVLNLRNPMFSRLELADGERDLPEDDGRLEVHEVLGLGIRGPLVYLSGCETGLGRAWSTRFAPGEDYTTLAQAFLYAGAGNVIATLWRVEDEGAADFARLFYTDLVTSDPAAALAGAQRAMIASGDRNAPYYWAAYRLSGTGS